MIGRSGKLKINNKLKMGKKIVWYESYTTICKYSAEITDEEAKLFEEDEDKFFDEVYFRDNQDLEWDKIDDEQSYDFSIEEDE
jgi:hypothetical protein